MTSKTIRCSNWDNIYAKKFFSYIPNCTNDNASAILIFQCKFKKNTITELDFSRLTSSSHDTLSGYKNLFDDLIQCFDNSVLFKNVLSGQKEQKYIECQCLSENVLSFDTGGCDDSDDCEYVCTPVVIHADTLWNNRLLIPTEIDSRGETTSWNYQIFTLGCLDGAGEMCNGTLLESHIKMENLSLDRENDSDLKLLLPTLKRILINNDNHENHNIHLYTILSNFDKESSICKSNGNNRTFYGGDGCEFIDRTLLQMVRYHTYGFKTFPLVNGCFLTLPEQPDTPLYFGGKNSRILFMQKTNCITVKTPNSIYYIHLDSLPIIINSNRLSHVVLQRDPF